MMSDILPLIRFPLMDDAELQVQAFLCHPWSHLCNSAVAAQAHLTPVIAGFVYSVACKIIACVTVLSCTVVLCIQPPAILMKSGLAGNPLQGRKWPLQILAAIAHRLACPSKLGSACWCLSSAHPLMAAVCAMAQAVAAHPLACRSAALQELVTEARQFGRASAPGAPDAQVRACSQGGGNAAWIKHDAFRPPAVQHCPIACDPDNS